MLVAWVFMVFLAISSATIENVGDEHRRTIFFPKQVDLIEHPCRAFDDQEGVCRLLVQCATFFAEIAELSRSPCSITTEQKGVCCPPNKKQTQDPVRLVPFKPKPVPPPEGFRAIIFPKVTRKDVDVACRKSLEQFDHRKRLIKHLADRKIVAPVDSPTYLHNRLFETSNEIFKKGEDANLILLASKNLQSNFNLNQEQSQVGLTKFDVVDTPIASTCPTSPPCPNPNYGYRTMDGTCNNLKHKDWGKTGVAFTRMILPQYEDGMDSIRLGVDKQPLPSARDVSSMVSPSRVDTYTNLTNLIWQWGQFLDHDITHTPISKGENKADISCCEKGQPRPIFDLHPECFSITISESDSFYSQYNQRCMDFVRSMPAIQTECKFGFREQMNQITSYIDASNVYGSTEKESKEIRAFNGGLLKVNKKNGEELLPGSSRGSGCAARTETQQCFVAGDSRVNEQPCLAVIHTVWVRQHNKLAMALAAINPVWTDEVVYQEARRIVAAQMQHITYNEYLPIVLGRDFMETFGLLPLKKGYFRGYRDDVDATIINSFATAAFRYGHTLITDTFKGINQFGKTVMEDVISKNAFLPFELYTPGTIDLFIRGLAIQQSEKFDRFFSKQLTNKLFSQSREFGMDLVALNIQRGRDHGLPAYTKWREVCHLPPIQGWSDIKDMDPKVVQQLQRIYRSVHDIDVFIGAVSEKVLGGSLVGPTFLCILGRQFIKSKIGDRFYYENGDTGAETIGLRSEPLWTFSEAQLGEIRKTSLSRILCDNSDNVQFLQPLAFVKSHKDANQEAVCASDILIPKMSLDPWKNSRIWSS